MFSLLIVVIYIAFISLGLPDALLGSAWPVMYNELNIPISYAGIISLIISLSTVVSSLNSDRLTKKFGTALVTTFSTLLTAIALLCFSATHSFILLCIFSIPYGLGAGAVDAALNNYVAINYSSKHMSWLHCFWGVGATISPYIMSFALIRNFGWNKGYLFVAIIQICVSILLFASLPLWKSSKLTYEQAKKSKPLKLGDVFKIKGVKYVLTAFFGYCAIESVAGLWACTYLVTSKGIDYKTAAMFASLFFSGITLGRFLCGFIADKFGDRNLIRYGNSIILSGILLIMFSHNFTIFALLGLIVIGLGCAPIYPSIIHSTPTNFGEENSQAIIGVQMASAYLGSALMPPIFGLIAQYINVSLFPVFLLLLLALLSFNIEKLWRVVN